MSQKGKSQSPKRRSQSPQQKPSAEAELARQVVFQTKSKGLWALHGYKISIGVFVLVSAFMLYTGLSNETVNIATTKVNEPAYLEQLAKTRSFTTGQVGFFGNDTLAEAKTLFFTSSHPQNKQLYLCQPSESGDMLEEEYNFRTALPECANPVVEQGNCSSSYAVATAGAIADRLCQALGKNTKISAMPMIACDKKKINNQCDNGYVSRAIDYAKVYGAYEEDCFPYDPARANDTCEELKQCSKDKIHKVEGLCVLQDEESIKKEIKAKGPVVAMIPMYRDLLVYKGGAYRVTPGTPRFRGEQAVKIIGWGKVEDKPVWIIENSLGESWGDQGLGYIEIGQQEFIFEKFSLVPVLEAKEEEPQGQTGTETEEPAAETSSGSDQ